MSDPQKPKFVHSAEILADWVGKEATDVVAEYRGAVHDSRYPSPDCLAPEQLLGFVESQDLAPQLLAHAKACLPCAGLLEAARPSAERRKQFLETLRREGDAPRVLPEMEPPVSGWYLRERFAEAFRKLRPGGRESDPGLAKAPAVAAADRKTRATDF